MYVEKINIKGTLLQSDTLFSLILINYINHQVKHSLIWPGLNFKGSNAVTVNNKQAQICAEGCKGGHALNIYTIKHSLSHQN